MYRLLLLTSLGVSACAGPARIEPCEPEADLLDPLFMRIGNNDILLASLEFEGCEFERFRLCGNGPDWLQFETASLSVERLPSEEVCDDRILDDKSFNIADIRRQHSRTYEVSEATLIVDVSGIEAEYSYPDPTE